MDRYEEKAINDIEEYGCHILNVLEEGANPCFSYSIGIEHTSRQPELIVTGLKQELAQWMVNEYNLRIRDGEIFKPNERYSGFLDGFEVIFKEVEKEYYRDYFGWGHWFYKGESFRVLQLIYPSTSGVWPWDDNAPEDYTWYLPQLYAAAPVNRRQALMSWALWLKDNVCHERDNCFTQIF